jgi:hypothetical protein
MWIVKGQAGMGNSLQGVDGWVGVGVAQCDFSHFVPNINPLSRGRPTGERG